MSQKPCPEVYHHTPQGLASTESTGIEWAMELGSREVHPQDFEGLECRVPLRRLAGQNWKDPINVNPVHKMNFCASVTIIEMFLWL